MPDPTDISAYTDEQKLAYFSTGDGVPVQPEGYADMAADHPAKVGYDESVTANNAIVALYQAAVDNGGHAAPSE